MRGVFIIVTGGKSVSYTMSAGHFHGDRLERRVSGDFILTEDSYDPGTTIPDHHHAWPYFCFVLEGAFTERCGRRDRDCGPGDLIYHPLGEEHSDRFARMPGRLFNIEIAPFRLEGLKEQSETFRGDSIINYGPLMALAMQLYGAFANGDSPSALAVEDLVLQLFSEALLSPRNGEMSKAPVWLEHAQEMIYFGFRTNLAVSGMAEEIGVHPVHLSRTYRKVYGRTISEMILHRRIEYACKSLAFGGEPLAVIAYDAGFADQSHFRRLRLRELGLITRSLLRRRYFSPFASL